MTSDAATIRMTTPRTADAGAEVCTGRSATDKTAPAAVCRTSHAAPLYAAIAVLLLTCMPAVARADIVDDVNTIRAAGCNGLPAAPPLRVRRVLNQAARHLARGRKLRQALEAVGYGASSSASVRVTSEGGDASVARTLRTRFCSQLLSPELREIGVYRRGDARWLVLAAPFGAPADSAVASREVLQLVNEARKRPRYCGTELFGRGPPVKLVTALEHAARVHSEDMAKHGFVEHTGRDGSSVGDRVKRTGYQRRLVGENLAAGPNTAKEVVEGWLASPPHCANIMDSRFLDMGVAYTVNPKSRFGVYWVQVFAAPR
jgi:uncharacterized protein YkwD